MPRYEPINTTSSSPGRSFKYFNYIVCATAILGLVLLSQLAWQQGDDQYTEAFPKTRPKEEELLALQPNTSLCSIHDFNRGQWKRRPIKLKKQGDIAAFEQAVGYHCPSTFHHRCYKRGGQELDRNKRIVDYIWLPETCSVTQFDASLMAKHLAEHPLLLVGDSITQLQFESLSCLLGEHTRIGKQLSLSLMGGNPSIKASQLLYNEKGHLKDKPVVTFVRSDYLVRLDDNKILEPYDEEGFMLSKGHNFPWMHMLPYFDYVILNTGPHWRRNPHWGPNMSQEELLEGFKSAMSSLMNRLKEQVNHTRRIWYRSTPFGHLKCSRYTAPQKTPVQPTADPYDWNMFEKFDAIIQDYIQDLGDERIQLFNVSFTNYRGDAHSRPDKDCLHTCLPGPVDDWNRLLYHEITRTSS